MSSRTCILVASVLSLCNLAQSFFLQPKWQTRAQQHTRRYQEHTSSETYLSYLKSISTLPPGFTVGLTNFTFQPVEVADKTLPMKLTIIKLDSPSSSFAAMFTSNLCPGGPILVGKKLLAESNYVQAIAINNKISNVCPGGVGDSGFGDSKQVCEGVAKNLNLESSNLVLPSSTGIIGWRLPVASILTAVPHAVSTLQSDSVLPAAIGICTTDRYPKVRRHDAVTWSLVGIAKGAGMIEPNMATMLSYLLTDLDIPKATLQTMLNKCVKTSFNAISVDGDQSTSDTVVLISSQKVQPSTQDLIEFESGLQRVCTNLAEDIVRNGEGTQHVIKIKIEGASSNEVARKIGMQVINSNLVKCAIAGCDPNVGRIVGAIGSYLGTIDRDSAQLMAQSLCLKIGGYEIYNDQTFKLDPTTEKTLSDFMLDCQLYPNDLEEEHRTYPPHERVVDIEVLFRHKDSATRSQMTGTATVVGSDLTKEYVAINADYRS